MYLELRNYRGSEKVGSRAADDQYGREWKLGDVDTSKPAPCAVCGEDVCYGWKRGMWWESMHAVCCEACATHDLTGSCEGCSHHRCGLQS